jgi:hypothetical protein
MRMKIHKNKMARDLRVLQADFTEATGAPFKEFYCPILFKDEATKLSIGHVVNERIPNSSRATVVQRRDVDNWYGSMFESDFVAFLEAKDSSLHDVMSKPHISHRLRPRISLEGKHIRHYPAKGRIAQEHTPLLLETQDGGAFRFALAMTPGQVSSSLSRKWELAAEADFRLSALVTMIKSAYLTLFRVLGYRYPLSPAGMFVGHDILGKFYRDNKDKPKKEVLAEAVPFFQPYVNMMRPILMFEGEAPQGTVDDNAVKACFGSSGRSYAMIVSVKTNYDLHAVLMPAFNHHELVAVYLDFLKSQDRETLRAVDCQFDVKQGCWTGPMDQAEVRWPKGHESFALA